MPMTNDQTPQPAKTMPELPAATGFVARPAFGPDGFSKHQGVSTQDAYTADQMHAYAREYAQSTAAAAGGREAVSAIIDQVNTVESAIEDASRQYHDSTRWREEPSVYDDRSSPSLQEVIDQGFNKLRDMICAVGKPSPTAPPPEGQSVEQMAMPADVEKLVKDLNWQIDYLMGPNTVMLRDLFRRAAAMILAQHDALTAQAPAEVVAPLGYTAIFNAIAAATWPAQEGVAINVSVAKFHESIGCNVYAAPQARGAIPDARPTLQYDDEGNGEYNYNEGWNDCRAALIASASGVKTNG